MAEVKVGELRSVVVDQIVLDWDGFVSNVEPWPEHGAPSAGGRLAWSSGAHAAHERLTDERDEGALAPRHARARDRDPRGRPARTGARGRATDPGVAPVEPRGADPGTRSADQGARRDAPPSRVGDARRHRAGEGSRPFFAASARPPESRLGGRRAQSSSPSAGLAEPGPPATRSGFDRAPAGSPVASAHRASCRPEDDLLPLSLQGLDHFVEVAVPGADHVDQDLGVLTEHEVNLLPQHVVEASALSRPAMSVEKRALRAAFWSPSKSPRSQSATAPLSGEAVPPGPR